jgi:hypothetical protein
MEVSVVFSQVRFCSVILLANLAAAGRWIIVVLLDMPLESSFVLKDLVAKLAAQIFNVCVNIFQMIFQEAFPRVGL